MNVLFKVIPHSVRIEIESNGVYFLEQEGGIGKTYLCKLFARLRALGKPCLGVTYDKFLCAEEFVRNALRQQYTQIILFDRFDLYCSKENLSFINSLAKEYIILLALKHIQDYDFESYNTCYITLGKNEIFVSDKCSIRSSAGL